MYVKLAYLFIRQRPDQMIFNKSQDTLEKLSRNHTSNKKSYNYTYNIYFHISL